MVKNRAIVICRMKYLLEAKNRRSRPAVFIYIIIDRDY